MDILAKIIQEKTPCFFISPHLDDAVFSTGGLISHLAGKTKVVIETVFTEAGPKPYTRFCRKFTHDCGFSDADIFFQARKKEDREICQSLGIDYQHLDFIDVAWRKKRSPSFLDRFFGKLVPEFLHLYPLGRNFMSGKVVQEDKELIIDIQMTLSSISKSLQGHSGKVRRNVGPHPESLFTKNYDSGQVFRQAQDTEQSRSAGMTGSSFFVFCPLAIGNHVDHVIIRDICKELFPANVIYWTDFPYINRGNTEEDFIKKMSLKSFIWNKNLDKKRELILSYKTQLPAIFPKGLPENLQEVYYLKS